jgi:beta-glucosidase-like glycosyl hydrolase
VGLSALMQAVAALLTPAPAEGVQDLTPREKAALVIVSGMPAPKGVAGVIVRSYDRRLPRPSSAVVFVDQEGRGAKAFDDLPPYSSPSSYSLAGEAVAAGLATGRALRREGVDIDLAPVVDLAGGPLGSRHFRRPALAHAFARGLARAGTGSCAKHFPGLSTARRSTDESPHVQARLVAREIAAFRKAWRQGMPCVMVSHAFYPRFGRRRASFSVRAYRFLRGLGFQGIAITDSVSVFGSPEAVPSALKAARAGADLILFTNGPDAARAIRALVPLARQGVLDDNVERVLELRRSLGLARP